MMHQLNSSKAFKFSMWSLTLFMAPITMITTYNQSITLFHWEILNLSSTSISFPIIIDPTGTLVSLTVLLIASNVLMFSESYMAADKTVSRFNALVGLFVLSMNMLVFFPSLITLLLGWDGLGLTSFLLIIYYQNPKSLGAGMITALTNRLGDAFLILAIACTLTTNNWFALNMWTSNLDTLIVISILLAAMTKSAQMPFSSWLPAAMAAPTPVSALVHSSTLVTAGVFLLIRFSPYLNTIQQFNQILLISASLTMLMAGLSATTECDFKKIIALSTLSQLGVMMACVALGLTNLATFHLVTHALFKALLFICAGNIIHLHGHNQDLRLMGNLTLQLPITTTCMTIANLSLCGAPFLAGFYSKDLILESCLFHPTNLLSTTMFFVATGCTAAYSLRFMASSTWAPSSQGPLHPMTDSDSNMLAPMIILSSGAIFSGSVINWLSLPLASEPILPPYFKLLPILATASGAIVTWIIMTKTSQSQLKILTSPVSHEASSSMWFLTPMTSNELIRPLNICHTLLKTVDHGWLEISSAQGSFLTINLASTHLQPLQSNPITTMLFMAVAISLPIIILY